MIRSKIGSARVPVLRLEKPTVTTFNYNVGQKNLKLYLRNYLYDIYITFFSPPFPPAPAPAKAGS